jgi:pyruvate/2-oxoglutarate/acetoin dehydrogenase E1 component
MNIHSLTDQIPTGLSAEIMSLIAQEHTIADALKTPEWQLGRDIIAELGRARAKFPGDNVTMLALMEEVGELAKATFEEPRANVRKEAIQVACMAMRIVLDDDATLTAWRAGKGLDALVADEVQP